MVLILNFFFLWMYIFSLIYYERSPLHQTANFSFRLHSFFVSGFWSFSSCPIYQIHIVVRFYGFQTISFILLDMFRQFLYLFFNFGGRKTNHSMKKKWILNAFQWTLSFWNPSNFRVYRCFSLRVSKMISVFKIEKECKHHIFNSMNAGWISNHIVGIPTT